MFFNDCENLVLELCVISNSIADVILLLVLFHVPAWIRKRLHSLSSTPRSFTCNMLQSRVVLTGSKEIYLCKLKRFTILSTVCYITWEETIPFLRGQLLLHLWPEENVIQKQIFPKWPKTWMLSFSIVILKKHLINILVCSYAAVRKICIFFLKEYILFQKWLILNRVITIGWNMHLIKYLS